MTELIYDYGYFEDRAYAELRRGGHARLEEPHDFGPCITDPTTGEVTGWPGEDVATRAGPMQLGQWLTVFASWAAYTSQGCGVADHIRTAAEAAAEARKAIVEHSAPGNTTAKRMAAKADPHFVALTQTAAAAASTLRLLRPVLEGYRDQYNAVSRVISLQQGTTTSERSGR